MSDSEITVDLTTPEGIDAFLEFLHRQVAAVPIPTDERADAVRATGHALSDGIRATQAHLRLLVETAQSQSAELERVCQKLRDVWCTSPDAQRSALLGELDELRDIVSERRKENLRLVRQVTDAQRETSDLRRTLECTEENWRKREEALKDKLAAAVVHRDQMKEAHDGACELVAAMHTAAVGRVCGPNRGVVEDVTDVRLRADQAEKTVALLREYPHKHGMLKNAARGLLEVLDAAGSPHALAIRHTIRALVGGVERAESDVNTDANRRVTHIERATLLDIATRLALE
jgi:hypothetical protein